MVALKMINYENQIQETTSLCPECLTPLKATIFKDGYETKIVRECPRHGIHETVIWRGEPEFTSWFRPKIPYRGGLRENSKNGCPQDCGLCENHSQRTCTALVEITSACNLNCPVCFADSGTASDEPSLSKLETIFKNIQNKTGGCNLQISGGEPTMRNDLPKIISLAVKCGFDFIQLNTNGIKLAENKELASELKASGLSSVFLQFDGLDDQIYRKLRGRDLFKIKEQAIVNISAAQIGIVLVPTLSPDLNLDSVWDIVKFGLEHQPHIRGVHFQPISYFGRFPKDFQPVHITLPEIMTGLETQSNGIIKASDFLPPGCEHALCSFSAKYLQEEDGSLKRLGSSSCDCKPQPALQGAIKSIALTAKQWSGAEDKLAEGSDELSQFIHKARNYSFSISAMAFQDCWNINLERLQGCCIHVADKSGKLIPFCAYNLTSRTGRSIHRPQQKQSIQKHSLENRINSNLGLTGNFSREEFESKQVEKLKISLCKSKSVNQYYQKKYDALDTENIKTYADLQQLPFTLPPEVSKQPNNFLNISHSMVEHIITMQSSGSTGPAKRFFFSKEDIDATVQFFATGMLNIVGQEDKVLILLPYDLEASVGKLLIKSLTGQGIKAQGLWPPTDATKIIIEKGITSIVGLPQHLLEISEQRIPFGQIKTVLLCSDYASPSLRKRIENNCGCETFLHYGSTETGLGGAVECGVHDGCHIREDEIIVEIIDPSSLEPLKDGEIGEIVITTLNREAMPLFRYRTGDLANIDRSPCKCGAKSARLKNIRGRINSKNLLPGNLESHNIDDYLFSIDGLLDYRLYLENSPTNNPQTIVNISYLATNSYNEVNDIIRKQLLKIPSIKQAVDTENIIISNIDRVKEFPANHRFKRTIIDKRI